MSTENSNSDFVISQTFDAPRELVFQSWVEPERLEQWWGPAGFTLSVLALDLEPGGIFHYGMRADNGYEMWGKFTYHAIEAPEKIVSVLSFADRDGNPVQHPVSATWPLFSFNTMTLAENDGKTVMTLRSSPHEATEEQHKTFLEGHESMKQGFSATFAQLAQYLATVR
ncbi:SRPBCC family protein [Janthinobacterium aquaticum]|uniref:SRPBCC family protein n=1 Tax=Janthinobacterium sp. FT58W TaxID=2654254 RepID=UPI0012645D4B|nr:SRPBCC domain-containing protein [Janthinobacterium sp. FT58W]KAB8038185.1 SRPBCC domain-containing protein [Janthinobacterium sp. FT58W]